MVPQISSGSLHSSSVSRFAGSFGLGRDDKLYNSRRMRILNWLLGPEERNHFFARWIFLRALGLIYFSAFYSFLFQIKGLNGPHGILPAAMYLPAVAEQVLGWQRFW